MNVSRLLKRENAHALSKALQVISYLTVAFFLLASVLALLGRIAVTLQTPEGYFERALLFEQTHDATSRLFYMTLKGYSMHLTLPGGADFGAWFGVALIGLLAMLPRAYAFWQFAGFFGNIREDRIFVEANAALLLRSGIAWLLASVLAPLLASFAIPPLANALSESTLSVGTTLDFSGPAMGAALLVAAYILRYGLTLQDEVDHLL